MDCLEKIHCFLKGINPGSAGKAFKFYLIYSKGNE